MPWAEHEPQTSQNDVCANRGREMKTKIQLRIHLSLDSGLSAFLKEGVSMPKFNRLVCLLLLGLGLAAPLRAADPVAAAPFPNPFGRSSFSAEAEIYSGGISGDNVGAAFHSINRGAYGARFTFGFMKALNLSLNYMYSNQTRTLVATTPPFGTLPSGTALARAGNLNVFFGSGEFNLIHTKRAIFYISPGVGLARNGARNLTLVTPLGVASAPLLPGNAVTFNLGIGVKIYPRKHLGFRFDVRDFVSGGGTGSLNVSGVNCGQLSPPQPCLGNAQQFFGRIPVQNNLVFTVGLIFKLI